MDKYITTKENLKDTVDKYGVAIIPNVLNEDECEQMVSEMWNYFEHITFECETPIDRNNEKSWKGIYDLFPLHSMLFQHFEVGHCQACWNLRQNQKIINIFSKI